MIRIVGLQLDGRYDLAALGTDDDDLGADPDIVHGGAAGVVIELPTGNPAVIGGPQAALSPLGRGRGWGAIATAARRMPLAAAVDHPRGREAHIAAAVAALGYRADEAIVAVPDLPSFDEAAQGDLLRAVGKHSRPRLLWRPVAAMLGLIAQGRIGPSDAGKHFRFLIQSANGIEDQILTLREDKDGHRGHFAPQRAGVGRLVAQDLGLDALFERAGRRIARNQSVDWSTCESSTLGPRLLTGDAPAGHVEILRRHDGSWQVVRAAALDVAYLLPPPATDLPMVADVAKTILVTPLAAPFSDRLKGILNAGAGPLSVYPTDLIARGCLYAGQLMARGLPHYFDKLDSIAIAVLKAGEPEWAYLIRPDEIVAANREFASQDLSGFVWRAATSSLEFYVRKGESEIRHWIAELEQAPQHDVDVSLRIRQTPGQSWGHVTVASANWALLAPGAVTLDWEELTPLDMTPEQVLQSLRRPLPTVPNRIVEDAHINMWERSGWGRSDEAVQLAASIARGAAVRLSAWARLLSRPQRHLETHRRYWLVGTDGQLPPELSAQAREGFYRMLACARQQLLDAVAGVRKLTDNDALRVVTWCFTQCPESIQDELLNALEKHGTGQFHPFLSPRSALTVIWQGAGRALTGEERLRRLFDLISCVPKERFNNYVINAFAMAITRRKAAPKALTQSMVNQLLRILGERLRQQVEDAQFKVTFYNTLSAIAGLFRWREIKPDALLEADGGVAKELSDNLAEALRRLGDKAYSTVRAQDRKKLLIQEIQEYLKGAGSPDVLIHIEEEL